MPCWIYLRADPSPVHCNEAADAVLERVERAAGGGFVQVAVVPYAHDDSVRTAYIRGSDVSAILPMHPRELEAELNDPPDWYGR
jgi:hypothetical protein